MVSTIFFVTFMLTFEIFKVTNLLVNQDISGFFILEMLTNMAMTMLPMSVPIAIYFSVIFCMNKLSGDSEYIALRAAGIDKKNLFLPFLVISILVAISLFFINEQIVPNAHRSLRQKIIKLSSTSLIAGLKSGQFFTTIPSVTIFPEEYNEENGNMKSVFLHLYNSSQKLEKVIFAKRGKLIHEKNDTTGIEILNLLLEEGNITNISATGENLEKILFQNYLFPMSEKKFNYKIATRETMMDFNELSSFIDNGLKAALKNGFQKKDYFNAGYEYWNRIVTPFVCIILSLLGFSLGVKGNRGHSKNSSGKAVLFLIGYFFIYFSFVSVARKGEVSVPLLLSIAPIGLLIISLRIYKKLDWQS
jgi:lipopolysaccharide export system permease protein